MRLDNAHFFNQINKNKMNQYQKAYLELAGLALTLYAGIRLVMYVIINS